MVKLEGSFLLCLRPETEVKGFESRVNDDHSEDTRFLQDRVLYATLIPRKASSAAHWAYWVRQDHAFEALFENTGQC